MAGSSRGLGKAIAQRFGRERPTVALTARTMELDPRYDGSLQQTLEEITALGGSAIVVLAPLPNRLLHISATGALRVALGPTNKRKDPPECPNQTSQSASRDGPWPAERVALLRRWIDAGKPA